MILIKWLLSFLLSDTAEQLKFKCFICNVSRMTKTFRWKEYFKSWFWHTFFTYDFGANILVKREAVLSSSSCFDIEDNEYSWPLLILSTLYGCIQKWWSGDYDSLITDSKCPIDGLPRLKKLWFSIFSNIYLYINF